MSGKTRYRGRSIGVLIVLAALVPAVTADISDVIYQVVVCNDAGVCQGMMPIDISAGAWQPDGTFQWVLLQDTNIVGFDGQDLGTLSTEDYGTSITITPPGAGRSFPQVNVNFSVIGGTTPGQFTINSALVSFPTIYSALGQVNVGINLTDRSPAGATLTNVPLDTGKSTSWVNGLPATGTLFRTLFAQDLSVTGGSANGSDQTAGFEPIFQDVSSISGRIQFVLSARDLASGSSTFVVSPEPASFLMLLTLALLRRR